MFKMSACHIILSASLVLSIMGCDRPKGEESAAQKPQATTPLPKESASLDASPEDLFVSGPLLDELLLEGERDGSALEKAERVVARLVELRAAKGLELSSAGRPGGARHAHELARLLLAPSPILETDAPTTDLELVALAVVTLTRYGVKASPAVRVNAREGDQLEHVVLAVYAEESSSSPRFFELTGAPLEEGAEFEPITQVEAVGLHHARLSGLFFMLNELSRSEDELELALLLAPELATPYYVRSMRDAQLNQPPERILADLSKVSLHKNAPEIWLGMGRALRKMKKYERAAQMFELVGEESASLAIAEQELAITSCQQGDVDGFFAHVTQARSSDNQLWEAHRDAAIVALSARRDALFAQAVRDGQRVQPSLKVWDVLLGAANGDRLADEELDRRRDVLGACASLPPEKEEGANQEPSQPSEGDATAR